MRPKSPKNKNNQNMATFENVTIQNANPEMYYN